MRYVCILLFILLPSLVGTSTIKFNAEDILMPVVNLPLIEVFPVDLVELNLAARLVHSEAGYQPFEGQVAVINTVSSRKSRKKTPFKNVVFQKGQYDGINSKRFYEKPTAENYIAARIALAGYRVLPYEVQYFHNKKIATDTKWIRYLSNYEYKTIGDHTFCWVPNLKPQA